MNKKYSYVGISFVLLLFGIYVVRNLDRRIHENDLVQEDRLNKIDKQDHSKITKILGWEPKVQLEQGLDRTIPYFKERIGA